MIDKSALQSIPYGLFLLIAKDGEQDNCCIVNTVMQITSKPLTLCVSVNKANLTHDMIAKTGVFNVSTMTESTPLYIFKRFGYKSGRNTDKFDGFWDCERSANGLYYLTENTNAMFSCKVIAAQDCGTHTVFFGEVTESKVISKDKSVTYSYYNARIKGIPATGVVKRWVCTYCNDYIYEGEFLPLDIRCPMCGDGYDSFKLIEDEKCANRRWCCRWCGYIYEGNQLAEDYTCPLCGHGSEAFDEI